jgi:acetyltransferase-like isoleucine patch superfamily enzyme
MSALRILRGGVSWLLDSFRHAANPYQYFAKKGAHLGTNVEFLGSSIHSLGSEPYLVSIGDGTTISEAVLFITHDGGLRVVRKQHPEAQRFAPIHVGANCFIGARSILMPGVTIGDGTVIGAGSVVTKDIEGNVVAAGNPARVIKTVAEYWEGSRLRLVTPPINAEPDKRRFLEKWFREH